MGACRGGAAHLLAGAPGPWGQARGALGAGPLLVAQPCPLQGCCPAAGSAAPGTAPASASAAGTWRTSRAWTVCTSSRWGQACSGVSPGGAGAGAPQSPGLSSTALAGEDREGEGVRPGQQAGEGAGLGLRPRERRREGLWVPGVGGSLAGRPGGRRRASPVRQRHHWGRRAWPAGWAQRGWRRPPLPAAPSLPAAPRPCSCSEGPR